MRPNVVSLALCGLVLALAAPARADDPINCGAFEIRASSTDGGKLAPELKVLEKKLKRPPFSSWNTFELLSQNSSTFELKKAKTLKLTDGQATILYREATDKAKKRRFGLTVTMDDKEGKRVVDIKVNVDSEDYVVVGRSTDNGKNGHVLALSCR